MLARNGRLVLVAGLVAGVALPNVATAMKPWLPELIGFLLFVTALRIDPLAALSRQSGPVRWGGIAAVYQMVTPVALLGAFWAVGWQGPLALGLVLMAAAPSISGSANLAILAGRDGTAALRLMILGTALVPLTALPVFLLLPQLGTVQAVLEASARLLAIIALASAAAVFVRRRYLAGMDDDQVRALDGFAALTMAVVVVALMAAVGPALRDDPVEVFFVLAVACAFNFGLQLVGWWVAPLLAAPDARTSLAIVMGNRNTGLFLTALPVAITDPILLFIGCYQIPMYLTPLVMGPLYRRAGSASN